VIGKYRLGIDIGGTFTDVTLLEQESGRLVSLKTPTVPSDPAQGIVNALHRLKETGVMPEEIIYFVHGTTIGLNTLLQRKGARIALLVTEGFRDLLALQRLRLPVPYDFRSRLPEPLVPRQAVFPVRERLLHDGAEHLPVDTDRLDRTIMEIAEAGYEGVAVCLLHSYRNPVHERQAAERIRRLAPGMEVCLSSELWPQMREYERAVLAVVNLYIQPSAKRYFRGLRERLTEEGLTAEPLITQSNGGVMDIGKAAAAKPRFSTSSPAFWNRRRGKCASAAGISPALRPIAGTLAWCFKTMPFFRI